MVNNGSKTQLAKVIAIDGPCGSGKSTVAKALAKKLNILFVDTGAMFRAIALVCHKQNLTPGEQLNSFLSNMKIEYSLGGTHLISINGEDLTMAIREHFVSKLASEISKVPEVRKALLKFQREMATERFCVMEGRDIGTIVFPDAYCKIFLTGSIETRSLRRLRQLQEQGDFDTTLEQVMVDVVERDEKDMNREVAPLKQADDAFLLDTTYQDLDHVLDKISELANIKAQVYNL